MFRHLGLDSSFVCVCEEVSEEHLASTGSFAVGLDLGLPRTASGRAVGFRHGCLHVKMPHSA